MKNNVILITLLFSSLSTFSQNLPDVTEDSEKFDPKKHALLYVILDEAPRFKKCKKNTGKESKKCFEANLDNFINDELKYPEPYVKDSLKARVLVNFKIDRKGKIFDIQTRSNLKGKELFEKEVVRLIKALPKLKAGKFKGKKVTTIFQRPITFSLE
jgi:TonB family protein